MTLQFLKEINGIKTNFVDKIRNGLFEKGFLSDIYYVPKKDNNGKYFKGKLHTIRGLNSKFKIGTKIHFKQWVGRPYYSLNIDFAPIIRVKSIQNIKILEFLMTSSDTSFQIENGTIYGIEIEGIRQNKEQIKNIAINDGFKNEYDFFNFFKRFEGVIIHWTDLYY